MPFNGSGVFSVVYNWANDAANGIKILASRQDTQWADAATNGLSNVICRDGQSTATALIPFANGISLSGGASLTTYATGTWTPADASGTIGAFTGVQGFYLKIGKLVYVTATLVYPVNADGSAAQIGGLPFTSSSNGTGASVQCFTSLNGTLPYMKVNVSGTTINLRTLAGANYQNTAFSGDQIDFSGFYQSAT